MRDVLTYGAKSLRTKAKAVLIFDDDLGDLLDEMTVVMRLNAGIGLSANQIGDGRAACVVGVNNTLVEMVNPQIIDADTPVFVHEACLSIPGWADNLHRWSVVSGFAQDRNGNTFGFRATHLKAQVIQHEIDHLDGMLFTDRSLNNDFSMWMGTSEDWVDENA